MHDDLSKILGLVECWGQSVFHCPYCHGYELNQGRVDVIATGPMSLHQAQMLPDWGEITFLTNKALRLDPTCITSCYPGAWRSKTLRSAP